MGWVGRAAPLTAALFAALPAWSAEFIVTGLSESGSGSLRQAVLDANANPGPDTIRFAEGLAGQVPLTTEIVLNSVVTIDGPGARQITISGKDTTRVFRLTSSANVTIHDVTIADGLLNAGVASLGGAISQNGGALSLVRCEVRASRAIAATGAQGGAIYVSNGTLTLIDCTFADNFTSAGTSAIGGAVAVNDGSLIIDGCLFAGNSCQAGTGSSGGALFLSSSTAGSIVSSTFNGNSASTGIARSGGAIELALTGVVAVESCTFWANSADLGGGLRVNQSTVTLRNSLLGENVGGNISGAVASQGHNIDTDGTGGFTAAIGDLIGSPGNQVVRPGEVSPLADHGGSTWTLALLPGNAAIDAGIAVPGIDFDQRGLPRSVEGDCDLVAEPDIGAFEYSAGRGLVLQAPNDHVALPAVTELNTAPALTLEAVITPRSLTGVSRFLSNTSPGGAGVGFGLSGGRLLYTSFGVADYYADHPPLSVGTPVHVAVVIDEAHDAYFYVDGSPVDVVAGANGRIASNSPVVLLGRNPNGFIQAFDGILSEVRVWSLARTGPQIQAAYDQVLTGSEPGLAGYWRFEEGVGDVAVDLAGDADGQLVDQPYRLQQLCSQSCAADLNDSGGVDLDDLLLVLGNYGGTGPAGDADFDADCDLDDLLLVLGDFGLDCH